MEESRLYETVRNVLGTDSIGFSTGHFTMRPAWKYAYYNASKKDENGQVIIRESKLGAYVILGVLAFFAVGTFLDSVYHFTFSAVVLMIVLLLFIRFTPRQTLIFGKEGLTVTDTLYRWDAYDGVYMAIIVAGKSRRAHLVFVKDDSPSAYITLGGNIDLSKIATPVRDFQPARYKDLL